MSYRCPLCGGTLVAFWLGPRERCRPSFRCDASRPFDRCQFSTGIAWWAETTLGLRLPEPPLEQRPAAVPGLQMTPTQPRSQPVMRSKLVSFWTLL